MTRWSSGYGLCGPSCDVRPASPPPPGPTHHVASERRAAGGIFQVPTTRWGVPAPASRGRVFPMTMTLAPNLAAPTPEQLVAVRRLMIRALVNRGFPYEDAEDVVQDVLERIA